MRPLFRLPRTLALLSAGLVLFMTAGLASADDDARMKQLRLLCAQLSGDLTDPGGIAKFRRCLTTKDPLNEIRRDNNIAGVATSRRPIVSDATAVSTSLTGSSVFRSSTANWST